VIACLWETLLGIGVGGVIGILSIVLLIWATDS